jgi:hypothetical protein
MGTFVSAAQATTLVLVTLGAVYKNGTDAFPPSDTMTVSRTLPKPGPKGAVHCKAPRLASSVTMVLRHGKSPMMMEVRPGKKFWIQQYQAVRSKRNIFATDIE